MQDDQVEGPCEEKDDDRPPFRGVEECWRWKISQQGFWELPKRHIYSAKLTRHPHHCATPSHPLPQQRLIRPAACIPHSRHPALQMLPAEPTELLEARSERR